VNVWITDACMVVAKIDIPDCASVRTEATPLD
jgi:hypothetical protein